MRRKKMSKDSKEGDLIPVKDGAGNPLSLGCGVVWTGIKTVNHLKGRVTAFDPGGLSIIETGSPKDQKTLARVKVTFEMIIAVPPGMNFLPDYFRTINPEQETIIGKILEKSDLTM
jgi:hypothetical protein